MVVIIVVVIELLIVVVLIAWLIFVVAVRKCHHGVATVTVAIHHISISYTDRTYQVKALQDNKTKRGETNSFRQSLVTNKNKNEKRKTTKGKTQEEQEHQHQQNGLRSARQSKDTSALSLVPPYLELIVTGTATWSLKTVDVVGRVMLSLEIVVSCWQSHVVVEH